MNSSRSGQGRSGLASSTVQAGVSGRANGSSEIPSSCTRHIFCPTEGSVATNWRIARGSAIHARLEAHVRPLQTPAPTARVLLPAHRARGIAGEMRRRADSCTCLSAQGTCKTSRAGRSIWREGYLDISLSLFDTTGKAPFMQQPPQRQQRPWLYRKGQCPDSVPLFGHWRQRPDLESNPPESGACGGALVPPENWVNEIPPRYTPSGVSSASHHAVRLTITSNHQVNSRSHIIERRILSQRHRMPSSL